MNGPVITGRPLAQGMLPPSRYRHPRDVIGLIAGAGLLALALAAVAVARRQLLGPDAAVLSVIRPDDAGLTLVGLVQVAVCAGGVAVVIAALPRRRFRLLAGWP